MGALSTYWGRTTSGDLADPATARTTSIVNSGLLLLVAVSLLLKLQLIFILNLNWDEFFYLSHIHQYLRGELTAPFQVFHVHLFWWLPLVSDSEVTQVIAGRAVMYALGLGSCAFTYLIARRFLNPAGALFAVLAYLSVSNIVEHGASFRADPLAAFLFLAALYLLLRRAGGWRAALAAGLLMALSAMVTIKAAIHLATIGAVFLVLLVTLDRRRATWMQIVTFGLAFAAGYGILYALHGLTVAPGAPGTPDQPTRFVLAVVDKVFLKDGLFPRRAELLNSLIRNPIVWGLMASRMLILVFEAVRRRDGALPRLLFFTAFCIPLLSVFVYASAFTYFYVFVLSPAVIVGGIIVDGLMRRAAASGSRLALAEIALLAGAVFVSFVAHYRENDADATIAERQVVDVVHEMFAEPVPYIDGVAMIASFPNAGFFMSNWGTEAYRAGGRPALAEAIAGRAPIFLLADSVALHDAMNGTSYSKPGYSLIEADRRAVTESYIPHWGIIYIAGKRLTFDTAAPLRFDVLIPGPYTIEAADQVIIDGVRRAPGEVVHLGRGSHVAAPRSAPGTVTLRWGDHLFRPTEPPSTQPIFRPFL